MTRGRAVVIGLGRSGLACARTLAAEGYEVEVVDENRTPALEAAASSLPPEVTVTLGEQSDEIVRSASIVCPSPGVPWDAAILRLARAEGVPVRSEMDLVFERCQSRVIGVTGSNGKTTTATLIAALLAAGGETVHLGGNIGQTVIDRLDAIRADDWVVLELSSFQLESITDPATEVAVVLNISPDHLDRHGSMDAYIAAKRRLLESARGTAVINADDPATVSMADVVPAPVAVEWFGDGTAGSRRPLTTVIDGMVTRIAGSGRTSIVAADDVPLLGHHNLLNSMAAAAAARAAGVPTEAIAGALRDARPVAHRLQPVAERNGVLWVNDSKATNVDAAITALRAFEGRPVIWIGGGSFKGVGPDALAAEVAARAHRALLVGATASSLDEALARRGFADREIVGTIPAAVRRANDHAQPRDVVLLAPGYASFDQFSGYEERGAAYAAAVRSLDADVPAREGS